MDWYLISEKDAVKDKTSQEVLDLLKHFPDGIPLTRLAVFYSQHYKRNLIVSELGFSSITDFVNSLLDHVTVENKNVFHKMHMLDPGPPDPFSEDPGPSRTRSGTSFGVQVKGAASIEKDNAKMIKRLLSLVKVHPEGVLLSNLSTLYSQRYSSNLTAAKLGFSTLAGLIASLSEDLEVQDGMVFYRTDKSQSLDADEDTVQDQTSQEVLEMIKEFPEGVPLKRLSIFYNKKYRKTLNVVKLGFSSNRDFINSLLDHITLEKNKLFYKSHRAGPGPPEPQPTAQSDPETFAGAGATAAVAPSTAQMTQAELLEKVKQVIRVYPGATASMMKLQNGYFQLFGDDLPLELYISLYDDHTSQQKPPTGQQMVTTGRDSAVNSKPASVKKTVGNVVCWQLTATPALVPTPIPVLTPTVTPIVRSTPSPTPAPASGSATSLMDFPPLGTKPSRAEERRSRESSKGRAMVFHEAHHAQLREVHGANLRALEALEDQDALSRGSKRLRNMDEVNSLVEDTVRDLAAQGEHVTLEKVENKVCALLQVRSLYALGIDPRKPLPALMELKRTIKEINLFIQSVEVTCSMCTLYELAQSIAGLKNKKRFEELHLGPLCKLPLVHRLFKIDPSTKDDDIHQIETVDLLRSLRDYRRSQTGQKINLAEFLQHLANQNNCDSPYELGVRINSVGLPISTLKKASQSEHVFLDRARDTIQKEIEEEAQSKLYKIKKALMEPTQGAPLFSSSGSVELRRKYVNMTAAEAVVEVFTSSVGVFSSRMTKRVQDFLMCVSGDRLSRTLFQLAICGGSLAVPNDLAPKENPQKQAQAQKTATEKSAEAPPTEAEVKRYFQECLSSFVGSVNLLYLCRLEKRVSEHFRFREFGRLQQGSFLDFLCKHLELLQDAAGGALALGTQEIQTYAARPSRQDVLEFIKQCGDADPTRLPFIEVALRSQYRVRDSRELGYGKLGTLADFARRQKQLNDGSSASTVRYECPLLPKEPGDMLGATVGLLGEVSSQQAMASLLTAPLLQDLAEWSQWELVFQPNHGPLKHFIDRYCGNTDLLALEVSPGVLLRITSLTGDKFFAEAAQALNPASTAGHLVSIVVADGISNTPTALLANHMESSLATAVAKEDAHLDEEECSFSTVARFLLECISLMPTKICKELLQQVFLEPLSRVLGQARSKVVLLDAARPDSRYLNKLHQLGILLGITEWVRDFHTKLILPSPPEVPSNMSKNPIENVMNDSLRSSTPSLADSEDLLEAASQLDVNCSNSNDGADDADEDLFELAVPENLEVDVTTGGSEEGGEEDEDEESPDELGDEEKDADEHQSQQRAVIEDIRKSEFGVGVELNEEGENLMRKHQARLGRSLERLSTELYSKDTHFVLELIQNADDNIYPDGSGVMEPALAFVVQRDSITVLNNECGFEERNIRAICDVGRSTKGKHTLGYIGQKGIGFKSVFKVTDRPEIESNGFHIRFDKTSSPMGYILPHWVDENMPLLAVAKEIAEKSWTTKIFLPLRSESCPTKNLFHDVHPSLLLFLHRLRSITIHSEVDKRTVSMTRRDLGNGILEVDHMGGVERWLVVKKKLFPKKIKEGVESTELALAFQLSDGSELDLKLQPRQQPVFAFLPLRSFGFRFIVQGDFDIPSSREDVDRDSSWNQWLRSEIPELFLHAMDEFTKHPELSGLAGLCHFLQFVPQTSEILDFFSPVATKIIQLLKGEPCLPTRVNREGVVEFKLPSQVAVCPDPLIQDVIGEEELRQHLNLSYLHPALQSAPSSLLAALGVQRLKAPSILTVVCAMARSLVQQGDVHSDASLKKLARLLACNFRALESEYGEVDNLLQSLREVPMIPLADQRVVALSAEGVFFPLGDGSDKGLGPLYRDLSIVEPRLLTCLDELGNSQVRELLRRLLVHELEPEHVLQQHIYPVLRNTTWKDKPKDVVVSYITFMKEHSQENDYMILRASIPVLTNKGFLCPAQSKVHFSKAYGNIDLPVRLPGVDWVLLDSCYLRACKDVAGWRDFFSQLGVKDLLIFGKERRSFRSSELASSPWAVEGALWPKPADGMYIIEDQHCEELCSLINVDQLPTHLKLQQRHALIELLQNNWDSGERYAQYISAQVLDTQGRPLRDAKSSFFHLLTQSAWVPAYKPTQDGQNPVSYLCPNKVYSASKDVHNLLGSHVHYIEMPSSEFSRTIGIKYTVLVEEMICYLKGWCTKESDDNGDAIGADFLTTVQHIHSVYCYLQDECSSGQLKELFQHSPATFIEYDRKDDWCSGHFYHLKDVCWSDPTGMFVRYKELIRRVDSGVQEPRVLAPFYSNLEYMKDMFMTLNVEPTPHMKQYVDLLELICESSTVPTADVLQDVSVIFARLADKCKRRSHSDQDQDFDLDLNYCRSLKEMVSRKRVFPTRTHGWVTLARKPMVSDSPGLEKIFKSHPEVCLLNLPAAQKKMVNKPKLSGMRGKLHGSEERKMFSDADRELFLEICDIKRLSQCVTTEPQTENYRPCPAMQNLVRDLIPFIQRFIYHHEEHGEMYRDLMESGIAQEIRSLKFGQVGKLYIYYRLEQPDEDPVMESEDIVCLLKDRKELYIQKDHLSAKLAICRELVKFFTDEKSFMDDLKQFLEELVIHVNDPHALRNFVTRKGIPTLPEGEETWEVPAHLEINPEHIMSSTSMLSGVASAQEEEKNQVDDDALRCWPPRASLNKTGGNKPGTVSQAVEAVMKMWPPPAPPTSSTSPAPSAPSSSQCSFGADRSSSTSAQDHSAEPGVPKSNLSLGSRSSGGFPKPAAPELQKPDVPYEEDAGPSQAPAEQVVDRPETKRDPSPVAEGPQQPSHEDHKPTKPPEVVASQFQGNAPQRHILPLDSAVWTKPVAGEAALEDLTSDLSVPPFVHLFGEFDDLAGIGIWGEKLVHSFLSSWKESGDGPTEISWYNEKGESGQPYDFRLTFASANGGTRNIYVEVKTTVKHDKHFVHLSANELDFALKEKESYHIYRVYGAGDSQRVRLCRIKNLAQHLHSKTLELFLFV